jgi:hypothetical protein
METALVTHQEGNEGEKNGVKRGNGGFYGGKLLKRKVEMGAVREGNVALTWPGLLSQQGAARTAVRIVTVHTSHFYGRLVPPQLRGLLMAAETDLFLRRCQIQHRHVAFGRRQMANGARNLHGGMHGLAPGLIDVTGGTVGIPGHDTGVLDGVFDGGRRHCRRQKQQGHNEQGNDPCAERELHG